MDEVNSVDVVLPASLTGPMPVRVTRGATAGEIDDMLASTIAPIIAHFADAIGLWPDES